MINSIFMDFSINTISQLLFMLLILCFTILCDLINCFLAIDDIFRSFLYHLFFENFFIEK